MPKTEAIYDAEQHGPLLTPEAAVAYLKEKHSLQINEHRLSELRAFPGGPRFIKPTQQSVRYPTALLDEWAAERNRKPILECIPLKPRKPAPFEEPEHKALHLARAAGSQRADSARDAPLTRSMVGA